MLYDDICSHFEISTACIHAKNHTAHWKQTFRFVESSSDTLSNLFSTNDLINFISLFMHAYIWIVFSHSLVFYCKAKNCNSQKSIHHAFEYLFVEIQLSRSKCWYEELLRITRKLKNFNFEFKTLEKIHKGSIFRQK